MRRDSHPWGTPPWTIDFRPARRPLPARVDFAVIGAGFAGLSAATWLATLAPGKSVVVLESDSIGNGASGRTGGMALSQTAAGPLPGLGDVLAGYKKILRDLRVDAHLALPGAWELARSSKRKKSAISWNDSGNLRISKKVPGGTVNPGKVLAGLARATQNAGAQIAEHAEVLSIAPASESQAQRHSAPAPSNPATSVKAAATTDLPLILRLRVKSGSRFHQETLLANQVLLTTNAGSLNLTGLHNFAEPKLTLAIATAPLTKSQLRAAGLSSHPFYTTDLPYLWGRLLENNGVIFGAGLIPLPKSSRAFFSPGFKKRKPTTGFRELLRFNVHRGAAANRFAWLESRVRKMNPAFKNIRVTHRWGGPILITKGMHPVFRHHAHHKKILTLGGFSGHGVTLSVYLGRWAAQAVLGQRKLPQWPS